MADTDEGVVHIEDRGGNLIRFFSYNGVYMPLVGNTMNGRMKRMKDFKAREDDIYIGGYPKSGSNWAWEIINMLVKGKVEYQTGSTMSAMMEFNDQEVFEARPSPRILNNHFIFQDLPKDVIKKRSKMVYLIRNPKDVCVSHYHHNKGLVGSYDYNGNWPDYLELWLDGKVDYGNWFTYVKSWEDALSKNPDLPICVVHYEDLKLNFDAVARRLATFLGVSRSQEFYKQLKEKCVFGNMKNAKASGYNERTKAIWRDKDVKFLRKGTIGDWKNHFTVAQNEKFDAIYAEEMSDSRLQFIFQL